MGLFTKNEGAKARRTQERQEQQKKEKAVPPPYVHTPTHALSDALLMVPNAYRGTDKQRLKRAHQQRLEKEAYALAVGSDTNVTNIPAKYWQGQPLPAQFKAPTPASFRELALSSPSLKEKNIELRVASSAQQQPQNITDKGYASGVSRETIVKPSREEVNSTEKPSCEPGPTPSVRDQAAEAGREAEVERLRRRIRELEGEQRAQNEPSGKPAVDAAPTSVVKHDSVMEPGLESSASSSDTLMEHSSGWSDKADSLTPPTSNSVTNGSSGGDGVKCYDWAEHWARITTRTKEERSKLPPATEPQQQQVTEAENKPCDASLQNFSRKFESASEVKHPRVCRSTRRPEWLEPVSGESSATVVGSMPMDGHRRNLIETPSYNYMADWDCGLAASNVPHTVRPDDYSSRNRSQTNRAEAQRKQP